MKPEGRIITVGLSPAWDVRCRGRGLDWGLHAEIDEQVIRPAGKALNVSSALAWMGCASIAAGLWGSEDHEQMCRIVARWGGHVRVRMTRAEGRTRLNVTVADTRGGREMHLRKRSELASASSLARLRRDLCRLIGRDDICVFAGAMPAGPLLDPVLACVEACRERGARLALDTHGPVLKAVVDAQMAWLIAPNVEELSELLGSPIPDTTAKLASAGRSLLGKVEIVLCSRGKKGAMVVTKDGLWSGHATGRGRVIETVGCGDYLLAGFLAAVAEKRPVRTALGQALTVATARAYGWSDTHTWARARRKLAVQVL
ncbi:MAG TPA: PfkB family carbohydrate kinase [Sedimentisphaerales bacterium]|nr:PfkB family carbohydrate kinase [Sedimentisphaerales bacterium]HRS11401.1 PfkB family carbohydrate kinase [Sedimentisphaerales bacterium]HRV48061.1 PfkB family carbohydrate kinase [Sedimentisphaerales bacterium]